MGRVFLVLSIIFMLLVRCNVPKVKLTNLVDPDIVLVNFEELDRASIANLLLRIDSSAPALIAIDAYFSNEKEFDKDSALINALRTVENDILIYSIIDNEKKYSKDSALINALRTVENDILIYSIIDNEKKYSHFKFRKYITDEGLNVFEVVNGLTTNMTPVSKIDNEEHELFPLKIVRHWKPSYAHKFKTNESIPIAYSRTINQFYHFNASDMNSVEPGILKGKIVLIGYLGPGKEDKYFTPLRLVKDYPENEPDTYGPVIVANAIRTILNYDTK